jgi:hypothetical protein
LRELEEEPPRERAELERERDPLDRERLPEVAR